MPTPAEVLALMLRRDSTRPRLTFYDDADGPTRGERIELSAKVIGNWVSKAGNALQEEFDAGPGTSVTISMPVHWRAVYWAMAAWSIGATVVLTPAGTRSGVHGGKSDVIVTDDPRCDSASARVVLASLPMLARAHPDAPARCFDEARELASFGDVLDPWATASADSPALVHQPDGHSWSYRDVVPHRDWGQNPRVHLTGPLERVLQDALAAWALDGSVVLVREPAGDQSSRLAAEAVTVDLS